VLAAAVGPIATTSANRHGEPTPATAGPLVELFGDEVALVVDGGPCGGSPSTVVDVAGPAWRVLRAGTLTLADLERSTGA
jgi:L-threonylcarbamoyladenylate synthase